MRLTLLISIIALFALIPVQAQSESLEITINAYSDCNNENKVYFLEEGTYDLVPVEGAMNFWRPNPAGCGWVFFARAYVFADNGEYILTDFGSGTCNYVRYGTYPTAEEAFESVQSRRITFTVPAGGSDVDFGTKDGICYDNRGVFTIRIERTDSDGDGIPDDWDECPNSTLSDTVVIAGCDSEVPNFVLPSGCTIASQIDEEIAAANSYGELRRWMNFFTQELYSNKILTREEVTKLRACAKAAR